MSERKSEGCERMRLASGPVLTYGFLIDNHSGPQCSDPVGRLSQKANKARLVSVISGAQGLDGKHY